MILGFELGALAIILLVCTIHYVADFWIQTEHQAQCKSFCNKALAIHCALYALPFLIFGWQFALITGLLHFATDYVSSRWSKHFFDSNEIRKGFQVVGLDQLVHMVCLFVLLQFFGYFG